MWRRLHLRNWHPEYICRPAPPWPLRTARCSFARVRAACPSACEPCIYNAHANVAQPGGRPRSSCFIKRDLFVCGCVSPHLATHRTHRTEVLFRYVVCFRRTRARKRCVTLVSLPGVWKANTDLHGIIVSRAGRATAHLASGPPLEHTSVCGGRCQRQRRGQGAPRIGKHFGLRVATRVWQGGDSGYRATDLIRPRWGGRLGRLGRLRELGELGESAAGDHRHSL